MKIEKINKVINNLQIKISEEGSSVTTFTYSDYIINYIVVVLLNLLLFIIILFYYLLFITIIIDCQ